MLHSSSHLACPRWLKPVRCRFTNEFDEALRDWTIVVREGLDAMGTGDDLWAPLQPPLIQWEPSAGANAAATLIGADQPHLAVTIGLHQRIHDFVYRLFTISDLGTGIGDASQEGGTLAGRAQDREWIRDPGDRAYKAPGQGRRRA